MLGHSHSLSGATAWAATCSLAPMAGVHPRWGAIAAGLLATAGAALLPDLDHPEATPAWTFGAPSRALARFVHRVSGGHRHATHSLLFAALIPLLTWLGDALGGRWFEIGALFVLYTFAARALRLAPGASSSFGGVAAIATWFLLPDLAWLPWAVAAGILAHLGGDCLTREGCPLLWPQRRHYMIPLVQRTGNKIETMLFAPAFALGAVALLAYGR
jgi:membrane-bound metal-dependent hydrolase YbcI (DUF457 family)